MTFLLVRHGQSLWNLLDRWQGHSGPGLTPLGRRQAAAVARAVAARCADAALVARSDLARVVETAAPIEASLQAPVVVDPRLRELDIGAWAGLRTDEVAVADPHGFAAYVRGDDVAFGGGERRSDLTRRVAAALDDLDERVRALGGATAVVVTHGGAVRAAARALLDPSAVDVDALGRVGNGSLTEIVRTPAGARLVSWAATDHLAGLAGAPDDADVTAVR